MAQQSKPASEHDKVFALDWRGLAEKRVLGDVLRLFGFRFAWLRDGDPKAYAELTRARRAADPNIRGAAELLLLDMGLGQQPNDHTEASKSSLRGVQYLDPGAGPITSPGTSTHAIRLKESKAGLETVVHIGRRS